MGDARKTDENKKKQVVRPLLAHNKKLNVKIGLNTLAHSGCKQESAAILTTSLNKQSPLLQDNTPESLFRLRFGTNHFN